MTITRGVEVTIAFFRNKTDTTPTPRVMDFADLCELVRASTPSEKGGSRTQLLSGWTFDGQRSANNVTGLSVLCIDYDDGTVAPEAAAEALATLGVMGVVFTTMSHGVCGSRWRMMLPLSAVAPRWSAGDVFRKAHAMVAGHLGGPFMAPESARLATMAYFQPPANRERHDFFRAVDGCALDAHPDFGSVEMLEPLGASAPKGSQEQSPLLDGVTAVDVPSWAAVVARQRLAHHVSRVASMAPGSGRGTACYVAGADLRQAVQLGVIDQDDAERQLQEAHDGDPNAVHSFRQGVLAPHAPSNLNFAPHLTLSRPAVSGLTAAQLAETNRQYVEGLQPSNIISLLEQQTLNDAAAMLTERYDDILFRTEDGVGLAQPPLMHGGNDPNDRVEFLRVDRDSLESKVRSACAYWSPVAMSSIIGVEEEHGDGSVTVEMPDYATGKPKRTRLMTAAGLFAGGGLYNPERMENYPADKYLWSARKDSFTRTLAHQIEMGESAPVKRLSNIIFSPQLGKDGTVMSRDGVYRNGRNGHVVFASLGGMHGRFDTLSMDVDDAIAICGQFISLFPWATREDAAVLLSYFFTLLSRQCFTLAPFHIIQAPNPGTGKSFAVHALTLIASGRLCEPIVCSAATSAERATEEMGKRIDAALISPNEGVIWLDDMTAATVPNVPAMRTVLSVEAPVRVRRMATHDQVTVDPTKLTWVGTANNVTVEQDMVRRSISSYFDRHAAMQRGWDQAACKKRIDALIADEEARVELLTAALTVLKHNAAHGVHDSPTENYEGWSFYVRDAVKLVTGVDPYVTSGKLKQADGAELEYGELLAALYAVYQEGPIIPNAARGLMVTTPALQTALAAHGCIGPGGVKQLEHVLNSIRNAPKTGADGVTYVASRNEDGTFTIGKRP